MKITAHNISTGFFVALGIVVLVINLTHPRRAQSKSPDMDQTEPVARASAESCASSARRGVAPYILQDTANDSPGTNFVTRIVTFTAKVGGTPAPILQWKIDKGDGFKIIPDATNMTYRIGNAQVEHDGFYALFATNAAGSVRTTTQQLVVTEGED